MAKLQPLKILHITELRNLLLGRFFLILAFRMLSTLLIFWVAQLTESEFLVGLIGLSEFIPAVACALYAGHVIDTSEKKKLLLLCNFFYIVLIGLLLIPAFFNSQLHLSGKDITYFIYGIIFLTGICRAFLGPIIPSVIPKIVSKEQLPNAISLNQTSFLTASITGHALAGLLIAWITIKWTLVIIIVFLIISILLFRLIHQHHSEIKEKDISVWESIKEGIVYIYKTKEVLSAISLDLFAVFFGGAVAMIPFMAKRLNVGAEGVGLLNAATDIGAMIIITLLSFIPLKKNQGKILLVVVAGFGLCIIGFGLSKIYWLSFVFLLISGLLDGISMIIRGTIVQLKTPDQLRGRVSSVNSIFLLSSNELGIFESGFAAKLLGIVPSIIFGGSMTVLTAIVTGISSPKLRKMEY